MKQILILFALMVPMFTSATGERTPQTDMLLQKMISYGYEESYARYIVNGCKSIEGSGVDARRCVNRATAIGVAESSAGKTMMNNNMFGFNGYIFGSKEEAFDRWLVSYKKYRYKHRAPRDFIEKSGYAEGKKNRTKNTSIVLADMSKIPLPTEASTQFLISKK